MRFITCMTNQDSGISEVVVENKGKTYNGFAKLHPEDNWSEFTGCRYAEERAEIKALKEEYQKKLHDCEECRKFVVAVSQYAKFNAEDPSARAMFRQLNRRIKEVNKLADEITQREFNLKVSIRKQDKLKERQAKND